MKFKKLISRLKKPGKPLLAVLVDPDKFNPDLITLCNSTKVSCILIGGSKLTKPNTQATIAAVKKLTSLPVLLFPGDETQLSKNADGLLLISLLSGRNPDYLIEKHITAAPLIKKMSLPYLSTAYLLIGGGAVSETQKVTKTQPLDPAKSTYIINTSIAAEQLGFKALYLEAGSGAINSVPTKLVRKIKNEISIPVIVGGGINNVKKVDDYISAGADMIVVGNAFEKNVYLLTEISKCF